MVQNEAVQKERGLKKANFREGLKERREYSSQHGTNKDMLLFSA